MTLRDDCFELFFFAIRDVINKLRQLKIICEIIFGYQCVEIIDSELQSHRRIGRMGWLWSGVDCPIHSRSLPPMNSVGDVKRKNPDP